MDYKILCAHLFLQGAFVYELVGDTTLPAPMMDTRGIVPLEGPHHTFDVFFPFANTQVRFNYFVGSVVGT